MSCETRSFCDVAQHGFRKPSDGLRIDLRTHARGVRRDLHHAVEPHKSTPKKQDALPNNLREWTTDRSFDQTQAPHQAVPALAPFKRVGRLRKTFVAILQPPQAAYRLSAHWQYA